MTRHSPDAASLSPGSWPEDERERLEKAEHRWTPFADGLVQSRKGVVSTTVSPLAAYAGVKALEQGGNAADAAVTVALTEINMQLGSVVSYAGIFCGVYYDAATRQVTALDGGFNSYLNERDPASIPAGDLGVLAPGSKPTQGDARGRQTLVPGFMAGAEALHSRFGKLAWKDLFAPAIWYAEHGIVLSEYLNTFFAMRRSCFERTEEGRRFIAQAGGAFPEKGALFVQKELAETLRQIAEHGAQYMYKGAWAEEFVRVVQREGGAATLEDLQRYAPIWSEPGKVEAFGHRIYSNGAPHFGRYYVVGGLNLAEASGLAEMGAYWRDPAAFIRLSRINELLIGAPNLNADALKALAEHGVDASPEGLLTKEFAGRTAPLLDALSAPAQADTPRHSDSVVVVDEQGNVAAITHTINTVVWGDSGMVVGGIPLPNAACFQQARLSALTPGDRLQHEIVDTIAFKDGAPVLATAGIGSSLMQETMRVLVSVLAQGQDLAETVHAPPLLANMEAFFGQVPLAGRPIATPEGAYSDAFLDQVRASGEALKLVPAQMARSLRGTLALVAIDPITGVRTGVDDTGVMVRNAAQ